ncbi:uncharacterized protein LOC117114751 [Anneissia japonica]|uniref:uncharacterized protein LOC117114751 n=1 Tax=Anneissia japonica TaxID=1529436 RepID=UPI0014255232|nr:uncharacterized protein LOC117114751 [Anneissia japonica]
MILCNNKPCKIQWFHRNCIEMKVLEADWICSRCNPEIGKDISSTTYKKDKAKEIPAKSKRKKAVERPTVKFTKDDAIGNGQPKEYLLSALRKVKEHPVYTAPYPTSIQVLDLATKLLQHADSTQFTDFALDIVTDFWDIVTAGDSKKIKPEANEMVCRVFHQYTLSGGVKWKKLMESLDLDTEGQHVGTLNHFVMRTLLSLILTDRHDKDMPKPKVQEPKPLDQNEEQVVRYVAGYVPYALLKKFKRFSNSTAKTYCKFLSAWKVNGSDTTHSFLDYSKLWIAKQSRGGLFNVTDDVYLFFRTLENENRKYLTISRFNSMPNANVKDIIMNTVLENPTVHKYWCNLTRNKIVGDASKHLLDIVIRLWIKIRMHAFLKVYLDLKKANSNEISRKSEKALRKDL